MPDEVKDYKEWIKHNENKWIAGGIITGTIAIITPVFIYFVSGSTLSAKSFEKLGTVGDFLGGSTVGLLSLTSILFLVSTLVMQRKELGLQRKELQLTTEELIKANKQYEITNETMLKQQFETTFFNMIDMHISLVKRLSTFKGNTVGIDVIKSFNSSIETQYIFGEYKNFLYELINECDADNRKELFKSYSELLKLVDDHNMHNSNFENFEETLNDFLEGEIAGYDIADFLFEFRHLINKVKLEDNLIYSRFKDGFLVDEIYKKNTYITVMKDYAEVFDNYFNSLNSIVDFVNTSTIREPDKKKYLSILCTQLSLHELVLVRYYVYLGDGKLLEPIYKEFKELKWKVGLPKNLWSITGQDK